MALKKSLFLALLTITCTLFGAPTTSDSMQGKKIKKITISIEHQTPSDKDPTQTILNRMQTKEDQPFDQELFDQDLKTLTTDYDWVDPQIGSKDGSLYIHLHLKPFRTITHISFNGATFNKKKLLKEGELETGVHYNRDKFNKGINKIREYYVKKGYFKAQIHYTLESSTHSNETAVHIFVDEGPRGRINEIVFKGFSPDEENDLLQVIQLKKYSPLFSWLTGHGTIKEEQIELDIQTIIHYLHNRGYLDSHVTMTLEDTPQNQIALVVRLDRGAKYTINDVTFSGTSLKEKADLRKLVQLKPGSVYSVDDLHKAQETIRNAYTHEGYLETNVDMDQVLLPHKHAYNIHFKINESDQYKIGLISVSGNNYTNKNVIFNHIDFAPGEIFNSEKLQTAQKRLQSTGYFKSVNIYPVQSEDLISGTTQEYRDVNVKVEEMPSGHVSLFAGLSTTESIFGGIDAVERNFNLSGIGDILSEGASALRGGGEYLQIKGQLGAKENSAQVNWLNPYLFDTKWRLGVDLNYTQSRVISNQYNLHTLGASMSAAYPMSRFVSYGGKVRIKDSMNSINFKSFDGFGSRFLPKAEGCPTSCDPKSTEGRSTIVDATGSTPEQLQDDGPLAQSIIVNRPATMKQTERGTFSEETTQTLQNEELLRIIQSSGVVAGVATNVGYDSTDNALKPHRGIRSLWEVELCTLMRDHPDLFPDFPYLRWHSLNAFYYPLSTTGTLKLRADFKFIQPTLDGEALALPLTERFFLGGENTVRGYKPAQLGPQFGSDKPTGGISSSLLSLEYLQRIVGPLDGFVFMDAGALSLDQYKLNDFKVTIGGGVRVDVGRGLPLMIGYGQGINEPDKGKLQGIFFSMAGEF